MIKPFGLEFGSAAPKSLKSSGAKAYGPHLNELFNKVKRRHHINEDKDTTLIIGLTPDSQHIITGYSAEANVLPNPVDTHASLLYFEDQLFYGWSRCSGVEREVVVEKLKDGLANLNAEICEMSDSSIFTILDHDQRIEITVRDLPLVSISYLDLNIYGYISDHVRAKQQEIELKRRQKQEAAKQIQFVVIE